MSGRCSRTCKRSLFTEIVRQLNTSSSTCNPQSVSSRSDGHMIVCDWGDNSVQVIFCHNGTGLELSSTAPKKRKKKMLEEFGDKIVVWVSIIFICTYRLYSIIIKNMCIKCHDSEYSYTTNLINMQPYASKVNKSFCFEIFSRVQLFMNAFFFRQRAQLFNLKQATQLVFTVVLLLSLFLQFSVRIGREIILIRTNVVRENEKYFSISGLM